MINQLTGFHTTYTGLLRNVRAVERSNSDQSKKWMENLMDLEHHAQDGRPIMVEIKISKASMEAGLFAQLRNLVGKVICFDVYSQQRVWNNSIYTDYYFSKKELPSVVGAIDIQSVDVPSSVKRGNQS